MTHAPLAMPLAVGDLIRLDGAFGLVLDAERDWYRVAIARTQGVCVDWRALPACARVDSVFDVPRESLVALYAYSEQLARRERVGGGR